MSNTKLTRRGWIVLVIVPALLIVSLFTYLTRDVCYVGTDKPYANAIGYGSCQKMLDDYLKSNK